MPAIEPTPNPATPTKQRYDVRSIYRLKRGREGREISSCRLVVCKVPEGVNRIGGIDQSNHIRHLHNPVAYHEKNAKHRNGNWVSHLNDFYGYTIYARWH
jgi:hypothetical protein